MTPFRHLLRARYPECDPQGIVFNARYGDWADLATTELLRALDPTLLEPGGLDYRLRRQVTEWLVPARFDDVVEAVPEVVTVGTTSFTIRTSFRRWPDGAELARTETVYVLVDPAANAKRPVPAALRDRLLAGAPGRVADHAGVGGGRVVRIVRDVDRVTMPWKNGGGVTHELVREGEGEAGFAVRLSLAEVGVDGPFSRFPGVDRVILLVEGDGLRLRRADGLEVALAEPLRPFAFHGEDDWGCSLLGGPTLDFNVMTDRSTRRVAVAVRPAGLVDATWLLALGAGHVGGVPVARLDLVGVEGPVVTSMAVVAVTVGLG